MKYRDQEKTKFLEDWQGSGKSACAYAKEKGLCQQTFCKWIKKRQEPKISFVEIPVRKISRQIHEPEIFIEKGEWRFHVPLEPVMSELREVLARLGQTLC
jgi:hypothetical protein